MEAEAKIRLAIDGQSVHAEMVKAQEDLQKVRAGAAAVAQKIGSWNNELGGFNEVLRILEKQFGQEMVSAYKNLIKEALNYNTVSESNVKALKDFIVTNGFTIEQIQNSVKALEDETAQLSINTDAWKNGIAASTNLKAAMSDVVQQQTQFGTVNKNTVPGVNQMRMAVSQLGFAMNDAQMFFVNARMGIMGISNNLPMIIQLMQQAKQEAGGNASMMKLLSSSIMGGGGLFIGLNALMFALTLLPDLFGDSKEGMKELAKEADDLAKKLTELEKSIPSFDFGNVEISFEKQNEFNTAIDKTIAKTKQLRDEQLKEAEAIKGRVNLKNSYNKLSEEVIFYDEKIKALSKEKEHFNSLLDRTQGKLVGLNDRMKTQNIDSKEWKNILSSLTNNEIKALTGSLEDSNGMLKRSSEEYKTATANLERLRKEIEPKKTDKTYAQIVADKIKYYDDLTAIDAKSFAAYKAYLDEQLEYYSKTLRAQKGGLQNFTEEQLNSFNLVREKLKELKELSKAPKIELGELEMEDIEFDADKVKRDLETLKQLRIDSIRDALKRQEYELEIWYAEQKESDLYKEGGEAKTLIDKQYADRHKEIMHDAFQDDREGLDFHLDAYRNAFQEMADLQKSGAEKWEAIANDVYGSLVGLLWRYIAEFITTSATELAIHTGTEISKTAVTAQQSGIRASMASAAGGGGGGGGGIFGLLGTLISFIPGGQLLGGAMGLASRALPAGFAKGGAIVGEAGPELIAPIESYIDTNRNLVTKTVLAVERSLAKTQFQAFGTSSGSNKIGSLLESNLEAIQKWQKQLQFEFAIRGSDLKTAVDQVNSYYNKFEVR